MNLSTLASSLALSAAEHTGGGEANLILPDLSSVSFLGLSGKGLLSIGILVSLAGLAFGLAISRQLKDLPVHRSMLGISGVAWFGIRVNTYANSRAAFASLRGKPFPTYAIPLKAGMSIGTMLISTELIIMLIILLFVPGDVAGPCFIGFAIGESLGASALRIAGGIFTKIADIGSDLMKIVFKIKEDDARNPGVIA